MICQEITLPIKSSTFWKDSTCVLRYIRNKEKRFQTFVANSVSILEQSQEAQWRYVDTTSNPADEASRGMSVDSLINDPRLTRGPRFLRSPPESWPSQTIDLGPVPEERSWSENGIKRSPHWSNWTRKPTVEDFPAIPYLPVYNAHLYFGLQRKQKTEEKVAKK